MDRRILTILEEHQLAKWLRSESRAGRAKNRDATRQEIVKILQCVVHTCTLYIAGLSIDSSA